MVLDSTLVVFMFSAFCYFNFILALRTLPLLFAQIIWLDYSNYLRSLRKFFDDLKIVRACFLLWT